MLGCALLAGCASSASLCVGVRHDLRANHAPDEIPPEGAGLRFAVPVDEPRRAFDDLRAELVGVQRRFSPVAVEVLERQLAWARHEARRTAADLERAEAALAVALDPAPADLEAHGPLPGRDPTRSRSAEIATALARLAEPDVHGRLRAAAYLESEASGAAEPDPRGRVLGLQATAERARAAALEAEREVAVLEAEHDAALALGDRALRLACTLADRDAHARLVLEERGHAEALAGRITRAAESLGRARAATAAAPAARDRFAHAEAALRAARAAALRATEAGQRAAGAVAAGDPRRVRQALTASRAARADAEGALRPATGILGL